MVSPLTVNTKTLRAEANVWDSQSGQLSATVRHVNGLHLTRLEAGIFQLFISAYDDAVVQVEGRCQEGYLRTREIAIALRQVADKYDIAEAEGVALFKNVF